MLITLISRFIAFNNNKILIRQQNKQPLVFYSYQVDRFDELINKLKKNLLFSPLLVPLCVYIFTCCQRLVVAQILFACKGS